MNGLSLDPVCVHCDQPIAAGATRMHYGHAIVRGVVKDISAHPRCFSFNDASAHAMQDLVLRRANSPRP